MNNQRNKPFPDKAPEGGPMPTPEGYRRLAVHFEESIVNELSEKGSATIQVKKTDFNYGIGDVLKINDRLFAKIKNLSDAGNYMELDLELLGD